MTVTSTTNRVSYAGAGTTGPFAFMFYVLEAADIKVYKRSTTGVETLLTITTDYSVSGAGNPAGGSVTTVAAVAVGETLVIVRDAVNTQTADYVEGDAFPAATHEAALDRRTMVSQRLSDRLDRALVLGETDTDGSGAYRANANRITNLAAATGSTDAVTLQQVTNLITGAGDLPVPTAGQEYLPLVADAGGGGASYVALTADGIAAGAVETAAIADANVTTAKIADNAVTLAKIAHATQGDLLYYGASGAPAVLGAGVAGQVLRTNGAAADPSWGWAGVLVTVGTSAEMNPVAVNSRVTQAHGLSSAPTFARMQLVCLTADLSFSPGDVIDVSASLAMVAVSGSYQVRYDATNIIIESSNNNPPYITTKATPPGAIASITLANWKLVATPYLIS